MNKLYFATKVQTYQIIELYLKQVHVSLTLIKFMK